MITVAQARERAGARLQARLGAWAADAVTGTPLAETAEATGPPLMSIALKPPSEREMLADERAAEAWAREWAREAARECAAVSAEGATGSAHGTATGWGGAGPAGVEVVWETRAWRTIGRQRVPVRLLLRDAEAVASFVGGAGEREWRRLRSRAAELADRLTPLTDDVADDRRGASTLAAAIRRHALDLVAFDDVRFEQVAQVSVWIATHEVAGLRPRQVPIRGVDSKWLGSHRRLVADLVAAATGSTDLGLLDADRLVRLRLLDDTPAVGGLRDLAAPAAQLARLDLTPAVVLIVENLESLLALPPWPAAVAVHGSGYSVGVVGHLPWVRAAPVLYWGDLDSNGFAILHLLRASHPDVTSVLMDEPTLLAHRDLWVPEPTPARGDFDSLTGSEARALDALRREGDVRLEQERIPWAHALRALRDTHRRVIGETASRAAAP